MKENNQNAETKKQEVVNNIYSEDNLITGSVEEEPIKEFEEWFKVKIQGTVHSYLIHDDGSLQVKFRETVEKEISGTKFNDYEDRSIRIRKPNNQLFTQKEVSGLKGKSVEIIDVEEKAQYKKLSEGNYDFNRVENYFYSADNIKVLNKEVPNGYQLFKIFELTVMDAIPSVTYNQRKKAQEIEKDKSVLLYEITNDTLITTHKITVENLPLPKAQQLKGKDVVVLDLIIKGKKYFCSKIKLK